MLLGLVLNYMRDEKHRILGWDMQKPVFRLTGADCTDSANLITLAEVTTIEI
jgi:hypothetical protein